MPISSVTPKKSPSCFPSQEASTAELEEVGKHIRAGGELKELRIVWRVPGEVEVDVGGGRVGEVVEVMSPSKVSVLQRTGWT